MQTILLLILGAVLIAVGFKVVIAVVTTVLPWTPIIIVLLLILMWESIKKWYNEGDKK